MLKISITRTRVTTETDQRIASADRMNRNSRLASSKVVGRGTYVFLCLQSAMVGLTA